MYTGSIHALTIFHIQFAACGTGKRSRSGNMAKRSLIPRSSFFEAEGVAVFKSQFAAIPPFRTSSSPSTSLRRAAPKLNWSSALTCLLMASSSGSESVAKDKRRTTHQKDISQTSTYHLYASDKIALPAICKAAVFAAFLRLFDQSQGQCHPSHR